MENKVTLLGYYGGDHTHANSAWQSTGLDLGIDLSQEEVSLRNEVVFNSTVKNKKKSMPELLKMLAEHGHETPFEKSTLHFQITADIASHIHAIKHRIGISVNSESARYKKLQDQWYVPEDWKNIKVSHRDFQQEALLQYLVDLGEFYDETTWGDVLDTHANISHRLYALACERLTEKLGRARAKESARFFLPYNKQLNFDMMFNFRSFIHFQKLRNSPHAQKEIREIAQEMLELVKELPEFKYSLEAFGYGD